MHLYLLSSISSLPSLFNTIYFESYDEGPLLALPTLAPSLYRKERNQSGWHLPWRAGDFSLFLSESTPHTIYCTLHCCQLHAWSEVLSKTNLAVESPKGDHFLWPFCAVWRFAGRDCTTSNPESSESEELGSLQTWWSYRCHRNLQTLAHQRLPKGLRRIFVLV